MRATRMRRGFALPAVLAVTGVVTLVFLVAITALVSLTAEAASARSRVRFLQRAFTAEATIAYLAATEPLSPQAFAVGSPRSFGDFRSEDPGSIQTSGSAVSIVNLDGRPYLIEINGALEIRLQDQAGLINLAALDDLQSQRLAARAGASPAFAREMRPRYLDYIDGDSLSLPDGAEQPQYGPGAPPNRPLRTANEWLSILGVRAAIDPKRWRSVRNDLAYDQTLMSLNVNTATSGTLQVLFGISEQQAEAAIRAREDAPFLSLEDFAAASGAPTPADAERIYTYPSGRVIYTIRDSRSAWTYRARLTLTPTGLEQPLWIDQTELTEAPRRAVADTSNATRFPYAPR